MMRPTRRLLMVAAVLLGLGLFAAPQAQAGWWHGHGYGYYGWGYWGFGCCDPCWTPVCTVGVCDPCCDGWYLGVRPGPIRRALLGPYRWYRSYGYCSWCCSDPCCCYSLDSCCEVSSTSTSTPAATPDVQATQKPTLAPPAKAPAAGTPNEPTVAPAPVPPAPAPMTFDAAPSLNPAPVVPGPGPASPSNIPLPVNPEMPATQPQAGSPASEGTISILVPDGAQVIINGYVTKSSGRVRRYVAQNLKAGLVYPFTIQVNLAVDGRTLTESRQVKLTGGALEAVVFNFDKTSVDRVAQAW